MAYTWMQNHADQLGFQWRAQVPELNYQFGMAGGAKVDAEVINGPLKIYIRIQGNFFHLQNAGVVAKDDQQRRALEQTGIVVDVWEDSIYSDLDGVMRDAINGIERPAPDDTRTPNRPRGRF